jgi:sugar phosphate isomerase/epimerase
MGESLAYAHISDVQENGKMCLPGKGSFDFETLIKRLQDVGFDGALLIEAYKDDYREISELKTACDYVNEILYKLNK